MNFIPFSQSMNRLIPYITHLHKYLIPLSVTLNFTCGKRAETTDNEYTSKFELVASFFT